MFHYVKSQSNYYYFDLTKFDKFVQENKNNIISLKDYIELNDDSKIVLSFDDGTIDHYENVFPILKKYNVTGVFSVCDNVFTGGNLNIQKIHCLLENVGSDLIYDKICNQLNSVEFNQFKNKFKSKEQFIKKILQQILPYSRAKKILDNVSKELNLSYNKEQIYINKMQLVEMQKYGNEFLYHTRKHLWLDHLSYNEQLHEIKNIHKYIKKLNFLNCLSLPFGAYNNETLQVCGKLHIDKILGIDYNIDSNKLITRVDCNLYK